MKIVLLSPLPPPFGGIAMWTERYLNSNLAKENNIIHIDTRIIGKRSKNMKKMNFLDEIKRNLNIIKKLKKVIKENKDIDCIHLNCPCSKFGLIRDAILSKITKKTNVKLLVHFRCDIRYMVNDKISLFFLKKLVNNANILLTLNSSSKNFLLENFNLESTIIPNYVSENYYIEAKKEKEIVKKPKKIVYTGHVRLSKGYKELLDVATSFPEMTFTVIGKVFDEVNNLKIPKNVKLIGEKNQDEIINYLKDSDIYFFPSHSEGFPNAVSEAMACGLPIIASSVGSISDMIEGKGGILCEAKNVSSFKEAFDSIKDIEKRKQMSKFNQNKVLSEYGMDEILNKIFAMYRNGELK